MKRILILILCFISLIGTAQFLQQAEIRSVTSNTLYRINLQPTVRMNMTGDFHDTRIYDSKGRETPFIVVNETPLKSTTDFIEYKIISQKHYQLYSELIVENPQKQKISNIAFNINNSDAHKYCAIEGSDDMKQWFSVSEKQELSLAYSNHYTNTYKCIYFPLNDYRYFRLLIDDFNAEPFQINSAGYFKNSISPGKLMPVSARTRIEHDYKLKKTLVHVSFNSEQDISRLDFFISAPRLFKREARIYVVENYQSQKQFEKHENTLFNFEINTNHPLFYDLSFRAKEFIIEINNYDSPELQIDSIQLKQLAAYLVADLSVNEKYTLKWGNNKLNSPQYDLAEFVSTVPHLLPEAGIGPVKTIPVPVVEKKVVEKKFAESKIFLWACIAIGAVIIIVFSLSLLKDMKKAD